MKKNLFLLALLAILIVGLRCWGWSFLVWLVALISGAVLSWSLLVRYWPTPIGVMITAALKLGNRLSAAGHRGAESHSRDWPQWFAEQAKFGWQPGETSIATRWMDSVDPRAPLNEYPRPQLVRPLWFNLNGLWNFNVLARDQSIPKDFPGQILVPFAIESALSGVQRPLLPGERLWYQREFTLPDDWPTDERVILHFGAVDWQASIYINGQLLGSHEGGFTAFSFDITDALQSARVNELVVSVWDPTDSHGATQQRGKQTLVPQLVNYTASSGIWQTAWLESAPARRITNLHTEAITESGSASFIVSTEGDCRDLKVEVKIEGEPKSATAMMGHPLQMSLHSPRLWTPGDPHLYAFSARLLDGDRVVDEIHSYFALREVGTRKQNSTTVLTLNGQPIFHHGPLDQGYWPEGLYTAPSDEALRHDIETMKACGFNMLRKHLKVEPARWYYHADQVGMLVWQDMVNGGAVIPPKGLWLDYLQHAAPLGVRHRQVRDNDYSGWGRDEASRAAFQNELSEMIDQLRCFPCIVMWVPFNEYWGQFDAARIAALVKKNDPTRLVNNASGFYDQGAGDIYDKHIYRQKITQVSDPLGSRAPVLGEYGGKTWAVPQHCWSEKTFGYGSNENQADYQRAYFSLMRDEIVIAIENGLAASVYTQLSDVEIEINGLMSYDRKVTKMAPEELANLHAELYQAFERRQEATQK